MSIDLSVPELACWRWSGSRWTCGVSWIAPVTNPVLETVAFHRGDTTAVVVRERLRGRRGTIPTVCRVEPHEYRRRLAAALQWPLEFTLIEIAEYGSCTVTAGVWGTAPLYLRGHGKTLRGSWDITELAQPLDVAALDPVVLAGLLTRRSRYSTRTWHRDIRMLTERTRITYRPATGLRATPPAAAIHATPRPLAADADPVSGYDEILTAAIHRWALTPELLACEISGGLDSAVVALTATAQLPRAASYGLTLPGAPGRQQRRRRRQLVERIGTRDVTVPAIRWAPLCPTGRRRCGHRYGPHEEPYSDCLDAVLARRAAAGTRVVLTGIGGDELMSLRTPERTEPGTRPRARPVMDARLAALLPHLTDYDAPTTVVSEPTLLAAACRAPVFLRHGIWPANPLCTPELIRYCEWLPTTWRRGKHLHVQRILRAGLPTRWPRPRLRENFTPVMAAGIRHHVLPHLPTVLTNSLLAHLGLVDPAELRHRAAQRPRGPVQSGEVNPYDVANLERALRSLTKYAQVINSDDGPVVPTASRLLLPERA